MFFLYGMSSDENSISTTPTNNITNTIKILNGIFDQINILNSISLSTNNFDTNKPVNYTPETLFNALFQGNLDAGELGSLISQLDHLEIQRKEYNSNEWLTLYSIYKNTYGNIVSDFTLYDTYTQNNTLYNYRVVPVDSYGNYGYVLQNDVLSYFNNAFICDGKNIFKLTNEYTLDNTQRNQISAVYTPLNSKYPYITYNALTNYDSGSVSAVLLTDTSQNNSSIDRKAQVKLVDDFTNWLLNGKAKILKDFNGNFKIISIINAVTKGYYKELGNGICSVNFTYNEVGDLSQDSLDMLELTNQFIFNNNNNS